jgi:pimeloyl-ACP methyl ester carboxylesterase
MLIGVAMTPGSTMAVRTLNGLNSCASTSLKHSRRWSPSQTEQVSERHVQEWIGYGPHSSRPDNRGASMPYVQSDGARLYYETAGSGTPIVFVHEFSGYLWSWEKQIQHFTRRYTCVAFNARGYPPSDVPTSPKLYSHSQAVDDVAVVMRHLKLKKAHIVGCSMGSRTALDFALGYPQMAMSVTMIGIGSGGDPRQKDFKAKAEARAKLYEEGGLAEVMKGLSVAPNRIQLKGKNPRAFAEFCERFMKHSAKGSALVTRQVMARRPSLFSMQKQLAAMKVPGLVVVGDEDGGMPVAAVTVTGCSEVCGPCMSFVVA